jgi:uncharacterized protein YbjT (DUF2867 family)
MNQQHILIHGATGTQGRPTAARLLADGHQIRVATRSTTATDQLPARTTTVRADLSDRDSLVEAYRNVDAVVVQLPLEFSPLALEQAQNVLHAVASSAVARVVLNVGGPMLRETVGVPYLDARTLLARELPERAAHVTIVGPAGTYMENLSAPGMMTPIAAGQIEYPLPAEIAMPWVALDDLAAVIADAIIADTPRRVAVVMGPEMLTGDQVAEQIGTTIGRPLRWHTVSADDFEKTLRPQIGDEAAAGIAAFYRGGPDQAFPGPDPDAIVTGTTDLRTWAQRQVWTT